MKIQEMKIKYCLPFIIETQSVRGKPPHTLKKEIIHTIILPLKLGYVVIERTRF